MGKYDNIISALEGLMDENTPREQVEKIISVKTLVETAATEFEKQGAELQDTRKDYVALIKKTGFALKEDQESDVAKTPKSVEELVAGIVSARKEK